MSLYKWPRSWHGRREKKNIAWFLSHTLLISQRKTRRANINFSHAFKKGKRVNFFFLNFQPFSPTSTDSNQGMEVCCDNFHIILWNVKETEPCFYQVQQHNTKAHQLHLIEKEPTIVKGLLGFWKCSWIITKWWDGFTVQRDTEPCSENRKYKKKTHLRHRQGSREIIMYFILGWTFDVAGPHHLFPPQTLPRALHLSVAHP